MPIYEITADEIRKLPQTTFGAEGIGERADLQRLLLKNIAVLAGDLFVISEEWSDWEDSRRRIDILALDRDAYLVVIELKRSDDGGHMELQALRYAAMVSALKFDRVVDAHRVHRARFGLAGDAQDEILAFLGWDAPREDDFAQDVRIILVAADFSKEITSTVLWLNERDLDITCIRLRPYKGSDGRVLIEGQQLIPLPEAAEFQVKVREKQQREREERGERSVVHRFLTGLVARPGAQLTAAARATPGDSQWINASVRGYAFSYFTRRMDGQVEVYIDSWDAAENLRRFNELFAQKDAIEAAFGEKLEWMDLPGKRACRIRKVVAAGGYRSPEESWPAIHDEMIAAMTKLERAILPRLPKHDVPPIRPGTIT